jgi:hypothetical protein
MVFINTCRDTFQKLARWPFMNPKLSYVTKKTLDTAIVSLEDAQATISKTLQYVPNPLQPKPHPDAFKPAGPLPTKPLGPAPPQQSVPTPAHHALLCSFCCLSLLFFSRQIDTYLLQLQETLDAVLMIQDWWTYYRSIGEYAQCMIVRVQRLLEFINSSLLDILVRDINYLIDRNMAEQRKDFCRFFQD